MSCTVLQATLLKGALAGGLSVAGLAGIGPDTAASLLAGAVAELLGRAAAAGQGGAIILATVPKQANMTLQHCDTRLVFLLT